MRRWSTWRRFSIAVLLGAGGLPPPRCRAFIARSGYGHASSPDGRVWVSAEPTHHKLGGPFSAHECEDLLSHTLAALRLVRHFPDLYF